MVYGPFDTILVHTITVSSLEISWHNLQALWHDQKSTKRGIWKCRQIVPRFFNNVARFFCWDTIHIKLMKNRYTISYNVAQFCSYRTRSIKVKLHLWSKGLVSSRSKGIFGAYDFWFNYLRFSRSS